MLPIARTAATSDALSVISPRSIRWRIVDAVSDEQRSCAAS
jgi:hypothetical protein